MYLGRARQRTKTARTTKLQERYLSTKGINQFYTFSFNEDKTQRNNGLFEGGLKIVQYLIER